MTKLMEERQLALKEQEKHKLKELALMEQKEQKIIPMDKKSKNIDKEFSQFYKHQKPKEKGVIDEDNIDEIIKNFDEKMDMHPERRIKATFKRYLENNLEQLKAEYPNLKLKQYKSKLWKKFKASSENPMNNPNNFQWKKNK